VFGELLSSVLGSSSDWLTMVIVGCLVRFSVVCRGCRCLGVWVCLYFLLWVVFVLIRMMLFSVCSSVKIWWLVGLLMLVVCLLLLVVVLLRVEMKLVCIGFCGLVGLCDVVVFGGMLFCCVSIFRCLDLVLWYCMGYVML